jgi:DNA-binding NarL/FixJ family response regulator
MKTIEKTNLLHVLLIEDSLPVLCRIRSLIEESVAVEIVGEAGTVAEALMLFRESEPDVAVLDLFLSDGTSFPVIAEIKRRKPACVVIVITHFTIPECRERCRSLGADHFFEKSSEFERVPEVLIGLSRAKELNCMQEECCSS